MQAQAHTPTSLEIDSRITSALRSARFDRVLALLGVLGLALAAIVASVMVIRGGTHIPPEGDLMKSLTFDAAIGIYYLTLAFLLPIARFGPRTRRLWVGAIVFLALYSYAIETIQIFRGVDPRFSDVGSTWDQVFGILFGVVAMGQIAAFVVLAIRFFRIRASLVVLTIRYASVATMLAFVAGIWMTVIGGRQVGESGSLLPLHALGFHALQAIPVLAWLLERSSVSASTARRLVHIAGAAWIATCLAVAWQTWNGRSLVDPTPIVIMALASVLLWAGPFLAALIAWYRAGAHTTGYGAGTAS